MPFTGRPRPERPALRPAYQGSNPISDVWSLQALRMVDRFLIRAVDDPGDDEARANMLLAAAYAGIGFGNAGVHLPHGMSYPVSGHVRDYRAPGYAADHPLVPHGISVILNAPAVFRFTAPAGPQRHLEAAAALGADVEGRRAEDAGEILADRITWFMQRLRVPNGLSALGYHERRHSRARRRHPAAASGDQAVPAAGRTRGAGPAVRARDGGLVMPYFALIPSPLSLDKRGLSSAPLDYRALLAGVITMFR